MVVIAWKKGMREVSGGDDGYVLYFDLSFPYMGE